MNPYESSSAGSSLKPAQRLAYLKQLKEIHDSKHGFPFGKMMLRFVPLFIVHGVIFAATGAIFDLVTELALPVAAMTIGVVAGSFCGILKVVTAERMYWPMTEEIIDWNAVDRLIAETHPNTGDVNCDA